MSAKLTLVSSAVCLLGVTQAAMAQIETVVIGTVTATIGDTAYEGETLDVPSEGTSTAEWRTFGPVTSLSIQAHDPKAASRMQNVLNVEITLMGENAAASILEASVSWWPEGMGAPHYINEGSGTEVSIAIDAHSLEEGTSTVSGDFSARLCRKDGIYDETDTGDCLTVDGRFDTALHKAD